MLLLDYQNVLIESLLRDRVNGCGLPRGIDQHAANGEQRSSRKH
jgi:hypothetical protein